MESKNLDAWSENSFVSTLSSDAKELYTNWKNTEGYSIKMSSYFSTYAELLGKYRNTKCTLVEIGVLDGASLFMWKKWLGNNARIIGIDLNPKAKELEKDGFEIFTGNQADVKFWNDFYSKVEKIDILIDDGGHQSFQQIMTVYCAICLLKNKCLIIVEDTASSFYTNMSTFHKNNSFLQFSKDATDILTVNQKEIRPQRWPNFINNAILRVFKNVESIQFFCGIVAYKVDSKNLLPSIPLINKRPKNNKKKNDFRKNGNIKGIEIEWPNPFDREIVTIEGDNAEGAKEYSKIKLK